MPPKKEEIIPLLGKNVLVVLERAEDEVAIVEGQLLSWSEGGECVVLDHSGFIHHCWPMLEVRELIY